MSAHGLESIAEAARRSGISTQKMKDRLFRLAKKIARDHPESPPLLILVVENMSQPGSRRWYLDRSVAWEHARGLVAEDNNRAWERLADALDSLRGETSRLLIELRDEVRDLQALVSSTHGGK